MNSINNITNIVDKTQVPKYSSETSNIKKKLKYLKNSSDDKKLMEACQEFESLFVNMLLKEMRTTIPDAGLTEKSTARELFEGMYDQEIAKKISKTDGGMGIAQKLYQQMKNR